MHVNNPTASNLAPQMAQDPNVVAEGTHFDNTGLGPILRYDSRDFPQNAFKGVFLQAQYLLYRPGFGGSTKYNILDLDYRQYPALGRAGFPPALDVRTRDGGGHVPRAEPSLLRAAKDPAG